MWVKTTCCNSSLSFLKLETSVYNVLVQSFTSTQAATCRELQLSLVFQLSWKGATTPLALALAKILVRRCWPTEGYNLLFLLGTTFHKFSNWIQNIKYMCITQSPLNK